MAAEQVTEQQHCYLQPPAGAISKPKMSVSRTSRCLFCSFKQVAKRKPMLRREIHASLIRSQKSKSKAEDDDLPQQYTPPRKLTSDELKQNFTPAQAAAIRAAEDTNGELLGQSTRLHNGKPWTSTYYDDFTEIDPVVDKPVKAPWSNLDDTSRLKTEEEFNEEIYQFMQNMPADDKAAEEAWQNFHQNVRLTVGKEEAEKNPRSAQAPDIPLMGKNGQPPPEKRKAGAAVKKQGDRPGERGEEQEISPALVRLMQMTGFDRQQLRKLKVKSIVSHRVVNQTRLGKIQKQYWLSIAGNGNGLLGIGEGKSEESSEGLLQSQYRAIRNMQPVLRHENRTIFGDVEGKSGATELKLFARPPGFGLRCQQYIWEMCRCAGISDMAARVTRARNPMNTVKAAFQALISQKDPEEIAKGRGKKLVDVRKVYYAGNV